MKRLLRFFTFYLVSFLIALGLHTASFAAEVTQQTTPAGFQYWHYPIPSAKRSAVVITWPSGISTLPAGQEVAARLGIDLMLNGGAGGKTPDELIADFGDLDAGSRLFVTPEEIVGFIVTPNKEAFKAATIANLVLKQPTFSANWFKRQKQKLVQQSIGRNKVVLGIGWSLSREIMMPNHSYKNYYSLLPLAELKSFELETIKKWHQTAFATDGVTIVATGTTDVQQLGEAIDKALEGLPTKQAKFVHRTLKINVPGKVVIFHAPKASKSMILTFGKAPAAKARQDVYLNTALGVLGYGKRSRLFKAVRTGLRASYGFRAGYIDYTRNQRLFHMSGEVETSKLQAGLDTVRQTYNEFRKDGIGFIEFPFARRYYRQRIEASLLKPRDAAYLLMNGRMNGASLNDFTSLSTQIDNMSRDQVNKFIKKEFAPFNQLLTIIVTPNATAVKGDCIITAYDQWKSCF